MKMQTLALFFLAAASIGGIAWVFLLPYLVGREEHGKAQGKRRAPRSRSPRARRAAPSSTRREQVETSLKQLEIKNGKQEADACDTHRAGRADLVQPHILS